MASYHGLKEALQYSELIVKDLRVFLTLKPFLFKKN